MNIKLVVLTGPTASGKTQLALKLARKFRGEIVSADSRQVYRGLDIGTGKIRRLHHLVDVASPKRTFTVAQYQKLAQEAIRKIIKKGKLPIIVGGSGFYIEALVYDLKLPKVKPNLRLRKRLAKLSTEALFKRLKKQGPRRAASIERKNKRRLIRALEIIEELGRVPPPSVHPHLWGRKGGGKKYNALLLGRKLRNHELKKRINRRVDVRLNGIIREIKKLRRQGVSFSRLINFGLEYKYFSLYLEGKLSKNEAAAQLKTATWQFARRQYNYLKRLPVVWVSNQRQAEKQIKKFLD